MIPVLFVMKMKHREDGRGRAFLHDESHSAFPDEKEFLIGPKAWSVTGIEKESLEFRGQPFEVTMI